MDQPPDLETIETPLGTPDAPAMKPRRGLFIALLFVYAIWVGILIVWAVRLR